MLAAYDGDRVASEMYYANAIDCARSGGAGLLELNIRAERAWFLAEESDPAEALEEIDDVLHVGREAGLTDHEPFCLSVQVSANRSRRAAGRDDQLRPTVLGVRASYEVAKALQVVNQLRGCGQAQLCPAGQVGEAGAVIDVAEDL